MTKPNSDTKALRLVGIAIVAGSLVLMNPFGVFVGAMLIILGNIL